MIAQTMISARSYYFRELCAEVYPSALERYTLDDFRMKWKEANCKALVWQKRRNNVWNHQTHRWEQRI